MTPNRDDVANRGVRACILGGVLICLLLQARLALVMEINWDEFFYLSHIYAYQSGEMAKALQSFQVHLLGRVTAVPGDEIDQIEAGRLFMLACFAGTCCLIYLLSRTFFSRISALVAVLVFASAANSIIHGASFRADPLAAVLAMASMVVLARGRVGKASAAAAGLLAAIAGLITIKIILYAPAFLGIAAWRFLKAEDRRRTLYWLGGSAFAAAASFAILYLVQLGLVPRASNAGSRVGLGNAAETQISAGLLPRSRELIQFILLSPLQTALLLTGIGCAAAMVRDRAQRAKAIAVLGCGATLLCLLLYRNAFPYFFPFILAPAAILAASAIDQIAVLKRHAALLAVGFVVPAVMVATKWNRHEQTAQRQLLSAVHQMFPRPVAYIDRNSMIASFPKRGFFMSTWGMQNYRRAGKPVFADVLARDPVPLVIANGPALRNAFGELDQLPAALALFDQDKASLRQNYIHHWGPLWVAGKVVQATASGTRFVLAVPGDYTVEGTNGLIDGKAVRAGQIVPLERGAHVFRSASDTQLTLRWGNHLPRPVQPFDGPVYRGF